MWLRVLSWLGLRRFTREAAATAPPPAPAELNAAEVVMQASARSIQVAHAEGDVTVGPAFQGTHIHHHYYDRPPADMNAAPAAMAPAAAPPATSALPAKSGGMTWEQKKTLDLLNQLEKSERNTVIGFMRDAFGTGLVKDLHTEQLNRVRRYVEKRRREQTPVRRQA